MGNSVKHILTKDIFSREDIKALLQSQGTDRELLFKQSAEIKKEYIGNKVWFRGLIEFSNICGKDCLYCGIRKGNKDLKRYNLSDDEILTAARFAYENRYGSIALQSGSQSFEDYYLVPELPTDSCQQSELGYIGTHQ